MLLKLYHQFLFCVGLEVPDRSPSPPKVVIDSNHIGAEEDIDDYKGLSETEIKELISSREAKASAQILEMINDIPDADAKPPENVLFVCKLNPVTTDEDLEIIFSRFGPILSCEVIRDQVTGDSLQYAFIEFENEDDCVSAYFKMDNVLIDDRRIHVDFSQSLAKVKGIRKRKVSEEQQQPTVKDDGFVSKRKSQEAGYDMVFDEGSVKVSSEKRSEKKRMKERERKDIDLNVRGWEKEQMQSDRRDREREREKREDRRGYSRHYEDRSREQRGRGHDREYKKKARSRSRSRSRDRHRDRHSSKRDRSRERHRRH